MTLIAGNHSECVAYDNPGYVRTYICTYVYTYVCTWRSECTTPGADLVLNISKCSILVQIRTYAYTDMYMYVRMFNKIQHK